MEAGDRARELASQMPGFMRVKPVFFPTWFTIWLYSDEYTVSNCHNRH